MLNLRTALSAWDPWIVLSGNKTEAHGVVLELYDELTRSQVFDFTYQFSSLYGGFQEPSGKWNGMVGEMLKNVN
ncbi:hypothetical protein CDAR_36981 [Caerostris darwini]|uniref:Lig_chan-Glu_bd domain-containing protein n=1 Tax=Caerostris darwini TaxID=1538125 RepID=A0AAV4SK29_9ARAC|nr:lig_chan-Glu_bd domain-containing protein [Caerostris darwini]GIY32612.1 hypothetical protein CDAR_36981 [Caerostris darwini]